MVKKSFNHKILNKMDLKTNIHLLRISPRELVWEISTTNRGEIEMLTVHKEVHLYEALETHANLIECTHKNTKLNITNPHYYRTVITPMILESQSVNETCPEYCRDKLNSAVLLGRSQYL